VIHSTHAAWLAADNAIFLAAAGACAVCFLIVVQAARTRRIDTRQIRYATVLLLFAVVTLWATWVDVVLRHEPPGRDFSAYYIAGTISTNGGALYCCGTYADGRSDCFDHAIPAASSCYAAALKSGVPYLTPFDYPPLASLIFQPFSRVPFHAALVVWTIISVVLIAISVVLAVRIAGATIRSLGVVALIAGALLCYPVRDTLWLGQFGAVILFLWCFGTYLLARRLDAASAVCWAAATLLKVTPFIAVPVLLVHRKWKWLVTYASTLALLELLSVWRAGMGNNRTFFLQLLPSMSCGSPRFQNVSVVAVVQDIFLGFVPDYSQLPVTLPPWLCGVCKVAALLLGAWLIFLLITRNSRTTADLTHELVMVALVTLLISPVTWWHHYSLAVLPLTYLWLTTPPDRRQLLAWTIVLVGSNVVNLASGVPRSGFVQILLTVVQPAAVLSVVIAYVKRVPSGSRSGAAMAVNLRGATEGSSQVPGQ
jgi:alpha-1,2-mannosyltransferase